MTTTPNFAMPLLFAAQAQKEITHNEALVLIDALLAGCAEGMAADPAALTASDGQCWIVAPAPVGAWAGRPGQLAVFTPGGWRFVPPVEGMRLFDRAAGIVRRRAGGAWHEAPAIPAPEGGATIDAEARATLAALLAMLRAAGMVAAT